LSTPHVIAHGLIWPCASFKITNFQGFKARAPRPPRVARGGKSVRLARVGSNNGNARVIAPVATARQNRTSAPNVVGNSKFVRVSHREYLGDVTGSTAFTVQKFQSINPGLSAAFPWLAPIARQYETYFVRSMSFEYETQESTATAGTICMALDYDPSDTAPQNKTQLLSYKGAVRSPGWAPVVMSCSIPDLSVHGAGRFVRAGTIASTDVKLYDVGNFALATQGFAGATVAGELYVSYVIDFMTPQSDPEAIRTAASRRILGGGTVNATHIFGDAPTYLHGLNVTALDQTLTFGEVGEYMVIIFATGSVYTDTAPTLTGTATSSNFAIGHDTAATHLTWTFQVRVLNSGETVIVDPAATCTTWTATDANVMVYQY